MERIIKKYIERVIVNTKEIRAGENVVYIYGCEVCHKVILGRTMSEVALNGARHLMSHFKRM